MANNFSGKKTLYNIFGYFLGINGIIFVLGSIGAMTEGAGLLASSIVAILGGGIPIYAGYKLIQYAKKQVPALQASSYEHDVLKLAAAKKGRLTQTDLAINLNLSIEESRKILENMAVRNIADSEVNEFGSVVYVFRDLLA